MQNYSEHTKLNEEKWNGHADSDDKSHFSILRVFQKKVIKLINLQDGVTFLDIGCGTGWAVRYAASLVETGAFYGIDLSEKMIEMAKNKAEGLKNVHFYATSAEHLPFESDMFDSAICTNSFHHHENPLATLKEVHRVLKPTGRMYIVDPTKDGIMKIINRFIKEKAVKSYYSSKEFKGLFLKAQFKYIMSKTLWYPEKVHIGEK